MNSIKEEETAHTAAQTQSQQQELEFISFIGRQTRFQIRFPINNFQFFGAKHSRYWSKKLNPIDSDGN